MCAQQSVAQLVTSSDVTFLLLRGENKIVEISTSVFAAPC